MQLVWEDDLASAFAQAMKGEAAGPFNIATNDSIDAGEVAAIHGQRLRRMPSSLAAPLAEALFRLRLSPVSADWVVSGEGIVSPERAKRELGWRPRFSSEESARMLLVQRGRPILPGRSAGVFGRKEAAEEALERTTDTLGRWARTVPGLRRALDGGPADVDRMAERVEHALLPHADKQLHLEVHEAVAPGASIVFNAGIGGYGRFYLPALGKLCDEGFNVVALDRPGHGLSEGRRGDCTIEQILDAVEATVRYVRGRFGGPVALVGSSLGGIINWFALTREPDVEAVVCHNIAHPSVLHEPAMRLKVPALKQLARVAPFAPVAINRIADFEALSQSPEILDHFKRRLDGIWCWSITARSAASLFEYDAPLDWRNVAIPTVVLVGEDDHMVSADFSRAVLAAASPPNAELRVLPKVGHLLFHDHLDVVLPEMVDWLRGRLGTLEKPAAALAEGEKA
jgi:pimeloyl-ACP methyl ester carboxylesterase